MTIQFDVKACEEDDKPSADGKMSANTKNPSLLKNPKKDTEWHQTLSAGCKPSHSSMCPLVIVKSLDRSLNSNIQVELDSHDDTSIVSSNVLVIHNHEHYLDFYEYDSKSKHKNTTTVNAAVAYDNLQTGNRSGLLIDQAIMIPSMTNILLI